MAAACQKADWKDHKVDCAELIEERKRYLTDGQFVLMIVACGVDKPVGQTST